ncbi:ATP-binding cassette domain-containing protein [Polyangium jinanense]|uniref:ATP-binding cassette domain-containing protein n=1 Tax=Polyangium jinanense TaxID=2829994 RepID=A0A9X3X9Q3_9BACT|nr:ATP-binding cassette domain-containing protein [Polyangium jinanense]MDC3960411.1 ATP-binding cassette domain-containing protein [Polyangium jinanense]MDC3985345.1 ATP-binding cassette domain-containing protein [Polyangium jinanense]
MSLLASSLTVRLSGRTLLHRASLEARPGEVLAVFGPSGAGKTTLFRVLVGELVPREGKVVLAGEDVTRLPLYERARRGLGYVPQTPSVLPDLSVRDNLAVFEGLTRRARSPGAPDTLAIARELGLDGLLDMQAARLSGGERRRLEITRALTAAPRVLVCDEPFAAVDPLGATRVAERLRALADAGAAVLVSDHHVDAALRLCDRAVLLLDGEIALEASPEGFRAHPLVHSRYSAT